MSTQILKNVLFGSAALLLTAACGAQEEAQSQASSATAAKADDQAKMDDQAKVNDQAMVSSSKTTKSPLFQATFDRVQQQVDAELDAEIIVPFPADAGGGYTHEQHKRNYKTIYNAGNLFRLTGEQKYADHVSKLLLAYAEMYPTLPLHPKKKEQTPGKLFWQSLNEAMWLVYAIQGYDAVQDSLPEETQTIIERDVFREVASYLSDGQPQTFNKIHNHGTWATAAVGMTGYALDDQEMVEKALLGLDKSGEYGFLKQLDELFSPDGYYSEGPYYQRFALLPFVVFAQEVEKNEPERKIFEHRDGVLLKAIDTIVHLSYNGIFFPINDAIKEKGLTTPELNFGLAAAYDFTKDPAYLSMAAYQNTVLLNDTGLEMAKAIDAGKAEPFPFKTMQLGDGRDGDRGALAIMRSGMGMTDQTVVVKNTTQGMGHGHFDKMALLVYDNGGEILSDYGAARFLNVVDKYGGHYLPENNLYAKQTIAHNALVVDETSHFDGKLAKAEEHHPDVVLFDEAANIAITTARMDEAYEGVGFSRTVAQVTLPSLDQPIILDIVRTEAEGQHQYDLPIHYQGQITKVSFPYTAQDQNSRALGADNGYQYLWKTAEADLADAFNQLTWLNKDRFYTYSFLAPSNSKGIFTRLGANDPDFNLRNETGFILRQQGKSDSVFVSVLEPHGDYNPSEEYTIGSQSKIENLSFNVENGVEKLMITMKDGAAIALLLSQDDDATKSHTTMLGDQEVQWQGAYKLVAQ